MKKLLRMGLLAVGVVLALDLLVCGILSWMARKFVSEENLVLAAEEQIDSRVQIGKVELSLFKRPAVITLRDVALGPRDAEVSKPPQNRAPLTDAPVRVKEVRLEVSLGYLLRKRLVINQFFFEEPHLAVTLYENGENSLDRLLRTPGGTKKRKSSKRGRDGDKENEDEILNTRSLNIYAHGFLARLQEVHMEDASLDVTIEKNGMVAKIRDLRARLDRIDLDPAALERTNTARVRLSGRIEIDASKDDLRYASLGLQGLAEAKLFDPRTGDLDLDLLGDFELSEESYLNARIPVVEKGWKALGKLEAIGLKIGELPEKATFGRSRSITIRYRDERFTLHNPISVWFKDWEIAVLEGTWLQTEQATHWADAEIIAERQLSEKLRKQIGRGVDYLPGELRPILAEEVETTWFRDGRLLAEVETEGELSRPHVDVRNKFPDLKAVLERGAKDYLKNRAGDLLRSLLDPE